MSSFKFSKKNNKERKRSNLKKTEKSRKQLRKELRKQKKINKAIYFQKKNTREPASDCIPDKQQQQHVTSVKDHEVKNYTKNNLNKAINIQRKSTSEEKAEKFEQKKRKQKKELLKQANLKEEKIIKKLEKQLKLNKRKKKKTIPKSFVEDGLDYLLDFCLEENRKDAIESEKEFLEDESVDEFKADLNMAIGEDIIEDKRNDVFDNDEGNHTSSDESSSFINEEQFHGDYDSCEDTLLKQSKSSQIESDVREIETSTEVSVDSKEIWEDIYGRKRDREGKIIQNINKYIPPAVRTVDGTSKDDETLKRKLKGCLNRVAEHNMHNIANQVEEMYMTNSRNNMNRMLTNLTMEALIAPVLTPNRLICEHMMLIAVLHANVGIEVGAHFLEQLIKKCIEAMEKPQDVENKELDNMILMISHLYNFKVYGRKLLYEILNKLTVRFTEKEIELVLLILKTVGFLLRKDDPITLKEFIQNLQEKACHEQGENSRVKFMLDILLAIKNNNVNKIPQYDPSHVEHLKKVMKSIIRKGNTITQFNVTLDDLLLADENGKWWIVGSAWSGSNTLSCQTQIKLKQQEKLHFGKRILDLAQKQRMNTDTRRNIFCILVTAEDYVDAFEKLQQLGLKDEREREILRVLMHCCLQENKFNPYYAILAQKFCESNRKYQLMIQYILWDKLKTLKTYGTKQLNNLARFLSHLFVQKCLGLSVLKVIQFTELDKSTMKLLRQIMLGILLQKDEEACLQVFERVSVSPELQPFREGLRLFINYFLIRNINSSSTLDENETTLKNRAELVDRILASRGAKIIF